MKTSLYIKNSSCRRYPNFVSKIRTMRPLNVIVVWLFSEMIESEVFVMF